VTRIEIHIIKSMCYTGKPPNRDTELTQIIFWLKRSYRTCGYVSVANSKQIRERKSRCMPWRISMVPKIACLVSRKKHASVHETSRINISKDGKKMKESYSAARALDYPSEIFEMLSLIVRRVIWLSALVNW